MVVGTAKRKRGGLSAVYYKSISEDNLIAIHCGGGGGAANNYRGWRCKR